jgi:hypothetical protein
MTVKTKIVVVVVALLAVAGCASATRPGKFAMPTPSAGDTEGQIMSVTGAAFTICGVDPAADEIVDAGHTVRPGTYAVTVCGNMTEARAALTNRFPGKCTLLAYEPDDGGPHTPQSLVMQWWIMRMKGPNYQVTETEILPNSTIDVGVAGDLKAAQTALNQQFPGWTKVHSQGASTYLVGHL